MAHRRQDDVDMRVMSPESRQLPAISRRPDAAASVAALLNADPGAPGLTAVGLLG
jgi:hypothetical protein